VNVKHAAVLTQLCAKSASAVKGNRARRLRKRRPLRVDLLVMFVAKSTIGFYSLGVSGAHLPAGDALVRSGPGTPHSGRAAGNRICKLSGFAIARRFRDWQFEILSLF
jgi:hypothetical protein